MNIIFQFGEFTNEDSSFWADLAIAVVGAFIGTGGAIWLYYRQTRDQKKKEDDNKVEVQKDKLRYLRNLLKDVILSIEKFSAQLLEFHDNVISYPTHLPQLKTLPTYNFDRIVNKLNQEDYYHAYVTLIQNENISAIFSLVEYFYGSLELSEQSFKDTVQYDLQRRNKFFEAITKLVNEMAETLRLFKQNNQRDTNNYRILNEFIIRYYEVLEPDPSNFLRLRDRFLTPLLESIYKITDSDEMRKISKIASTANKLLTPVILSNQDYAKELKKLSEALIKANNKLKERMIPLDEYLNHLRSEK